MSDDLREGWYNDPTGRHSERWYIAGHLTSRVRDGGEESTDPVSVDTGKGDHAVSAREGWYVDPLRRHQYRWFSAGMPTALVKDGELDGRDPLDLAQFGEAAFAVAEHGPGLPDPPQSIPTTQGPVAWWDGWVPEPGEPRLKVGLDGATGLAIEATMRAAMRSSAGRSPLSIDLRILSFAVVTIGIGIGCLFLVGPFAGLVIALGFLILAWAILAGVFDFVKELPARRLQRRSRRNEGMNTTSRAARDDS